MRKITLIWMMAIVVAGLILYQMKYTVREMRANADRLEAELLKEQESLHVLKAEWAHLAAPERLQALSDKYLILVPASGQQLATHATLKARLEPIEMDEKKPAIREAGYGR